MTDTSSRPGPRPGRQLLLVLAVAVIAAGAVALALSFRSNSTNHDASGPAERPGTASASVGSLRVYNAYIPAAASPDVAAGYFVVTNSGDQPDTLTGITSPDAASVQIHETVDSGGASTMKELSQVDIPAHGTMELAVGHRHLMLMKPSSQFRQGDSVQLTLQFAKAGSVTLVVPVLGIAGPSLSPSAGMSGMPGMSGMGG